MMLTTEQEEILKGALDEMMRVISAQQGVIGFACVVVANEGPITLFAGEQAIVGAALDLLNIRYEEVEIERNLDKMAGPDEPDEPDDTEPSETRH